MTDVKMADQFTGHENARHENVGPKMCQPTEIIGKFFYIQDNIFHFHTCVMLKCAGDAQPLTSKKLLLIEFRDAQLGSIAFAWYIIVKASSPLLQYPQLVADLYVLQQIDS